LRGLTRESSKRQALTAHRVWRCAWFRKDEGLQGTPYFPGCSRITGEVLAPPCCLLASPIAKGGSSSPQPLRVILPSTDQRRGDEFGNRQSNERSSQTERARAERISTVGGAEPSRKRIRGRWVGLPGNWKGDSLASKQTLRVYPPGSVAVLRVRLIQREGGEVEE